MNREQWNTGRKYEKLTESKKTWEKVFHGDPRWQDMLDKVHKDPNGIIVIDNEKGPGFLAEKWEDHFPPKPRLL